MRPITQSSEYAIRALTHLGRNYGDGFHLAHEMARELGMPAPFLTKILRPLVECGLLESQRGRNGGFRLAHPPAQVTLHQIVASQEPLGLPRRCFLGQSECSDDRACPMHDFWKRASRGLDRTPDGHHPRGPVALLRGKARERLSTRRAGIAGRGLTRMRGPSGPFQAARIDARTLSRYTYLNIPSESP